MDERHVATAGVDQCGEIGVLRVAARLAPDMHPVSGAGDRAGHREVVRHQRRSLSDAEAGMRGEGVVNHQIGTLTGTFL
jgi:hypothetical protein